MKKNTFNKNTIYNTIKSVFGVLFPILTFPYISRTLMAENVGKINFGNSIISYISLIASLGISTYAIRECSKVKYNKEQLSVTSSQIFSINIVSTLIAYIVLAILLICAKPLKNYRILILIQSTIVLFTTLGADWLNTAMEDFKFIAIRTMLMQAISFILMIIFIRKPEDYLKYVIISVIASSGANIINIFYRRKYCKTSFTFQMDIKKHFPKIILLFSLMFSQTIFVNSDMTILGLLKGDYEVGLYSTSVKMYNIINSTIASITWVVMPKLSYYFAREDYPEINSLLKYALNYIAILGIPCLFGLEVLAPHLIMIIAGEEYIGATTSLRILGLSMLCSFISGWLGNMIRLPSGKEKESLKIAFISGLLNVVFNLLLIPNYGLNAAAFSTLISEFYGMIVGLFHIDKRIRIDNIKEVFYSPIIGSLGIIPIALFIEHYFETSWAIAITTIFISVVWYVLLMFVCKNAFFMDFVKHFTKN